MAVECAFNFSSAIIGLAGVALGGLIGFCSARYISDRNARITACAKLRAAFAPILATIYIEQRRTGSDVLKTNFAASGLASVGASIEEFRPFASDGDGYEKAWEHYRQLAVEDIQAFIETKEANLQEGGSIESAIQTILRFAQT